MKHPFHTLIHLKKVGETMGISKKQYALAAKAGLTREQASRFIGTAGKEPSPTAAYDKIGNLLKGRSVGQAFKQAEQTRQGGFGLEPMWLGLPKSSALAGIKPIEPEVSQAQPPEQPKVEASTAQELVKPIEPEISAQQPQGKIKEASTADKMVKPLQTIDTSKAVDKIKKDKNWVKWAETANVGQHDQRLNHLFSVALQNDTFKSIGGLQVKKTSGGAHIELIQSWDGRLREISINTNDSDSPGQMEIKTHEVGHLIDWAYYIKTNKKVADDEEFLKFYDGYFSRKLKDEKYKEKVRNFFQTSGDRWKQEIQIMVDEFKQNIGTPLTTKINELEKQYRAGNSDVYEEMMKLQKDYNSKAKQFNQTANDRLRDLKVEKDEGIGRLSDIYSALSAGQFNQSWNLEALGIHDKAYYRDKEKQISEIWAEYLNLKASKNQTNYNKLKEFEPELVEQLEKMVAKVYATLGGK